ncbi:hypothetical protein ACFL17_04380 [Pseudomonadota bacterium]
MSQYRSKFISTSLVVFLLLLGFSSSQAQSTASGTILQITPNKVDDQLNITVTAKNSASKYVSGASETPHKYRVVLLSQRSNPSIFCSARIDESKWITLSREQIGTFQLSTSGSCWDIEDFGNLFLVTLAVDGEQGERVVDRVAGKIPD